MHYAVVVSYDLLSNLGGSALTSRLKREHIDDLHVGSGSSSVRRAGQEGKIKRTLPPAGPKQTAAGDHVHIREILLPKYMSGTYRKPWSVCLCPVYCKLFKIQQKKEREEARKHDCDSHQNNYRILVASVNVLNFVLCWAFHDVCSGRQV